MHASCGKDFETLYHREYTQTALDKVTISFRKMNLQLFLVIWLKTTFNITAALTATMRRFADKRSFYKGFQDQDWDAYRNNSVGFIFQNYHLILI